MKIPFEEIGTGLPIVLLHAFPLSSRMWQPQIKTLIANGHRLILPDLRGFGQNNNFSDINLMEDMAQDVAELLASLKIVRALIGGLSMGGYITFELYRRFPELFTGMLLFDTNSASDSEEKKASRLRLIEQIEERDSEALLQEMLPNLVSRYTFKNNPELVENLQMIFREVNPKAAIAALRGMAQRRDHGDILKSITVPTLLLFGEDDKVTNLEIAWEMHTAIPDSTLSIIKNAGHYSNLEQPDEFNYALIGFISSMKNK
jgi:3-oxoadipate enol-lactonase